jgi:CRP-like cAMP-binding protein
MRLDLRLLRQLTRESRYVVDERTVAAAMMMRAESRVPGDRADVGKQLDWFDRQLKHGDLAKALNLDRGTVSRRLAQLARAGDIKKASPGYSA